MMIKHCLTEEAILSKAPAVTETITHVEKALTELGGAGCRQEGEDLGKHVQVRRRGGSARSGQLASQPSRP
jgi:hypothetical protein